MALIYVLLAPLFQLAQIIVKINPYSKLDKRGEYRKGIFLTKDRQKSRGGKVIMNTEATLFALYLYSKYTHLYCYNCRMIQTS